MQFLSIQQSDCLGIEADFIATDFYCPFPEPGQVQVMDRGKICSNYPLRSPYCSLQSGPVLFGC